MVPENNRLTFSVITKNHARTEEPVVMDNGAKLVHFYFEDSWSTVKPE